MKSFAIHWHAPFFHSRQICGGNQQESILASRECPGAVHRKVLGKAATDGPGTQLLQPEIRIIRLMLECCYIVYDPETTS